MDLKSVSLQDLERAFTGSVRDLLGEKYEVIIENLDFVVEDPRTATITLRIHEQKYTPSEFSEASES